MGVGEWVAGSGLDQSSDQWEADEPAGRPRALSLVLPPPKAILAILAICGEIPRPARVEGKVKPCMHARIHTCRQSMQAMGLATGRVKKYWVVLALVFPCQ